MKRNILASALTVLSFIGALAFSSTSSAEQGYVGGFAGMSVPNLTDTSARPMFGILGGARLDGEWGVGAYFLTSSKKETMNNTGTPLDTTFSYSIYGVEGSYHFEGMADNAWVAVRIGLTNIKAAPTGLPSVSYTPMAWGIAFGYDYMINEMFSLGGEAGYMAVQAENKAIATENLKGFGMINFAVAAKFWF